MSDGHHEGAFEGGLTLLGNFLLLSSVSLLIGVIVGLMSALITKWFRVLTHSAITETMMLFLFGYLSYAIAEMAEMSGIISLLTCGVTMAHYSWFNLSP